MPIEVRTGYDPAGARAGAIDQTAGPEGQRSTDGDAPKPGNRDLVSRAIALLARRDLSRAALIARLLKDGFDRQECEAVSRWCESCGFLNEHRHAEGLARRLGARYGALRVSLGMRQRGVDESAMNAALDGLRTTEVERARALVARRFREDGDGAEIQSRKYRFLRQRGFSGEVIHRALKPAE